MIFDVLNTAGLILIATVLAILYLWATYSWWGWWVPFIIWGLYVADTGNWAAIWIPVVPWLAAGALFLVWWAVLRALDKPMDSHPLYDPEYGFG